MSRFSLVIATHLFKVIGFRKKMLKALNNPNITRSERYKVARNIVQTISDKSQAIVESSGKEMLPKEDGYLLCANHQGRFDGIAIICTYDRPLSMVVDDTRSDVSFERYFIDLTESIRLNRSNPKETIISLQEISEKLQNKQNFCIFPEGIYGENKNTLQEFHSGTFHTIKESRAPIVPVCLYDTHKIYNVTLLKKTKCSVHYLKPIYYDEYKDLSKKEIADLVKSRIQEKINELNIELV